VTPRRASRIQEASKFVIRNRKKVGTQMFETTFTHDGKKRTHTDANDTADFGAELKKTDESIGSIETNVDRIIQTLGWNEQFREWEYQNMDKVLLDL